MAVIATLDVGKHTAHLTLKSNTSFAALVMLGIGAYPSVWPERMNPDNPNSMGGNTTVSLAKGKQKIDITVGLNFYDYLSPGETSNPVVQVLYIENANTGEVVMDDTEVDELVKIKGV